MTWSIDPLIGTKQYVGKHRTLLSRGAATDEEVEMWKLLMEVHRLIPVGSTADTADIWRRIDELVGECVRVQGYAGISGSTVSNNLDEQ